MLLIMNNFLQFQKDLQIIRIAFSKHKRPRNVLMMKEFISKAYIALITLPIHSRFSTAKLFQSSLLKNLLS